MIKEDLSKFFELIRRFRDILTNEKQALFSSLYNYASQKEGWFLAEMLHFLDTEKKKHQIVDFNREVSSDTTIESSQKKKKTQKKIDFSIDLKTEFGPKKIWVEFKHWHIGFQKGVYYHPKYYIQYDQLTSDLIKLLQKPEPKFFIVFCTHKPSLEEWEQVEPIANARFSPTSNYNSQPLKKLRALSIPFEIKWCQRAGFSLQDFPPTYFIGILEVVIIQS